MVSNIRHQTKKQSQQKPNRWTALYIHSTSEVLCPIIVISPLFVEVYFSTLALSFINWDSHQSSCSSLWTVHRGFWSGATRDAAFQRVKQHLYLEAVHIGTNIQVLVIDAAATAAVLAGIAAVGWLLSLSSLLSSLLVENVFGWWDFVRVCFGLPGSPCHWSHFGTLQHGSRVNTPPITVS